MGKLVLKMKPLSEIVAIKDGIADRLRESRVATGRKQGDLAPIGGISRATQVSYESGETTPSIGYLKAIQDAGVDVPFIICGTTSEELDALGKVSVPIDWERLRFAHEDVEFFCQRNAPNCPANYRWAMVADLYRLGNKYTALRKGPNAVRETMAVLVRLWDAMA